MHFSLSYQLLVCKRNTSYEPGRRDFESLQARRLIKYPCANTNPSVRYFIGCPIFSNENISHAAFVVVVLESRKSAAHNAEVERASQITPMALSRRCTST